jgi:hypothetical protein
MSISTRFTPLAAGCCAVIIAACAGDKGATKDSAAGAVTPAAEPAPRVISLADVAGKWNVRSVPEAGDTTVTTYVLNATADTTGWTITFPGGKPIPVQVKVDGDSIITGTPIYDSVRRKGMKVRTTSVARLDAGTMVGTAVAHYVTTKADSVLRLRFTGTRAP